MVSTAGNLEGVMYHSVIEGLERHGAHVWQGILIARFKYTHGKRGCSERNDDNSAAADFA
jgi:hypothetical protein